MSRAATIAQFVAAGAVVAVVFGAAAAGLTVELVRRGVVAVLPWGRV